MPGESGREKLQWGSFRRVTPFERNFGYGRGTPIDRHYIERFLNEHQTLIRGSILEALDSSYTRNFGGTQVTHSDVLHRTPNNPLATVIADLNNGPGELRSGFYDCIILTQTLLFVYDLRAALRALEDALKPGGTLPCTVPGISQIDRIAIQLGDADCWRFTDASARMLFEEVFPPENVRVRAHGNVLAAIAFLHGLSVEELSPEELDYCDPDYQLIITVRATKAA